MSGAIDRRRWPDVSLRRRSRQDHNALGGY